MKLYAVIQSWFFEDDIEDVCVKGEGHLLSGIYTDLDVAREKFADVRDSFFIGMEGWQMPIPLSPGVVIETDIDTDNAYWKARLDGYGYSKVSIETFDL